MDIIIDNIKINYIVEGEGKPVLILHGWGASIEAVMPIVNALKDKRKIYAVDLPGHGKSSPPESVFGTDDYADTVHKFIKETGISKCDIVGHSFGAKTILALASKNGEDISKIVLIDSSGINPKRTLKYYFKVYSYKLMKRMFKLIYFKKSEEDIINKFSKNKGSDDYRNTSGIMRKVFVRVVNEDLKNRMHLIKNETLILWGKDDEDTPLYMGKIMQEKIENSALIELEGGHYSYADDYQNFVRIIRAYLCREDL